MSALGCSVTAPAPIVCGGSWIFRLSDTNSSVSVAAEHVPKRADQIHVCLESEAVENGQRGGATLVVHREMKGAVVGMEGGDVEVEGGVGQGVCNGAG